MATPSTQPTSAPPEVESTLARLTAHPNVQGVLILSRPQGLIIRSAGSLFALPPSSGSTAGRPVESDETTSAEDGDREEGEEKGPVVNGETARRYAAAAVRLVEATGEEVGGLAGEGEPDDVRFLRIRTRRHELMITPDEQYILVVVQDPTH
ncbi:hypothetical protein JCM8097_009564 [Rhodosporidiobolus ruineniae]